MDSPTNLLAWALYIGLGLFLLSLFIICGFILHLDYPQLLAILIPHEFYPGQDAQKYQTLFFHPQRWLYLRGASKIFIGLGSLSIGVLLYYRNQLLKFLEEQLQFANYLIHKIWAELQSLSLKEKCFLIIYFLSLSGYLIYAFYETPKHQDENWSYQYFVKEGFWVTLTYYPDTNNHIAYNLMAYFLSLFLGDARLIMKLPTLLAFLSTLFLIYAYVAHWGSFRAAVLSLLLAILVYESRKYAYIGRGHILLSLFVLISSIAMIEYLISNQKGYVFIFILSSILGFYTVPIFIFHFIALGILMLLYAIFFLGGRNITIWLKGGRAVLYIIIGTTICYTPVILISGWEALFAHKWVQPMTFQEFWTIFPVFGAELFEYILGVIGDIPRGYLLFFPIATWFLWVLVSAASSLRERLWYLLLGASALSILGLSAYLKVLTPYRSFTYFMHLFYIALALSLHKYFANKTIKSL